MSELGFGLLRLPLKDKDVPDSYDWDLINEMVDLFMEMGGSYFDTCYTYLDGFSEMAVKRCVAERKPRASFKLAEKIPGYECKSYEDCQKFFDIECERCGVDFFDVLMLHWLNRENYAIAEKQDQFRFLREMKKEGKARLIGFSYHDDAELLDRILTEHPEVDVVQIQLNYLDWDTIGIESGKCYDVCVSHGKKVYVMEPVKGGILAELPEEAEKLLRNEHPDRHPAQWAIKFAGSLPEVDVVLSGMNSIGQIRSNMSREAGMTLGEELTDREKELLRRVSRIIHEDTKVQCTGCGYCRPHCPQKIYIPQMFRMYNEIYAHPEEDWKIKPLYEKMTAEGRAAHNCVDCGMCRDHCPQNIDIPGHMKEIDKLFSGR